jgi:DNA repair exonuclease SbcCD ATPase subunit
MLNDVRTEYNSVSKELDIECAKYEEVSNTLSTQQRQQNDAEQNRLRSLSKLNLRLENCAKEINTVNKKIKNIDEIDTQPVTANIQKIDEVIQTLDTKTQALISQSSKAVTMIDLLHDKNKKMSNEHSVCPTCLHNLDDKHKKIIADEKRKIESQITALNDKREKVDLKLKETKDVRVKLKAKREQQTKRLQQIQIEKHNNKNLIEQLSQLKSQQEDIKEDIKSVESTKDSYDTIIKETEKRLESFQSDIDKIKKELSKLEIIKFIVSEEGVKSYIVKKILQLFNAKLSYYLKKMDSNCICVFNEYFEEEIIDEKGKQCSYFNFSGAERKNIDLACLFAFMDIRRLQGDVAFNFSMYDELFDSSLDERGVELVIEILKERITTYNECVIVISHRKESTKLATGEVIFLEKQNGVTTRVETPESELK